MDRKRKEREKETTGRSGEGRRLWGEDTRGDKDRKGVERGEKTCREGREGGQRTVRSV